MGKEGKGKGNILGESVAVYSAESDAESPGLEDVIVGETLD